MNIEDIKKVLSKGEVEYLFKLPEIDLPRKDYLEIKKALKLIGGEWVGGKIQAFKFEDAPTALIEELLLTDFSNLKQKYQFFGTPEKLAEHLVYLLDIQSHDTVLEPHAGQGSLIRAINKCSNVRPDCYELMPLNVKILKDSGLRFNLLGIDFLKNDGKEYTKIVANPPFSNNQDIKHVMEMYETLSRGGRLVSVVSNSWVKGSRKAHIKFREWLDGKKYELSNIDKGTFKDSGTIVGAKILTIDKPIYDEL